MLSRFRPEKSKWLLFNLLVVATLGVVMRYKIAFNFPYLDQKNLQNAHSHFAFLGWVSQSLLVIFFHHLKSLEQNKKSRLSLLIQINLILSYGMLLSFVISGHSFYSIFFESVSLILFILISIESNKLLNQSMVKADAKWFKAAFLFGMLSSAGTISLSVMMATRHFDQSIYLSSVYWYLHFQYNGYFLFMCLGFLQLQANKMKINIPSYIFQLLFISTFFSYGLSVLWLKIPAYIYVIIVLATVAQSIGMLQLVWSLYKQQFLPKLNSPITRFLFGFVLIASIIKYLLQAGSTIPVLSTFAFGFRSIVIAYLHLVLLAIISVSIIAFLLLSNLLQKNPKANKAIVLFAAAIFLNELVLGLQGLGAVSYSILPYANEALLSISCLLWVSILYIFIFRNYQPKIVE